MVVKQKPSCALSNVSDRLLFCRHRIGVRQLEWPRSLRAEHPYSSKTKAPLVGTVLSTSSTSSLRTSVPPRREDRIPRNPQYHIILSDSSTPGDHDVTHPSCHEPTVHAVHHPPTTELELAHRKYLPCTCFLDADHRDEAIGKPCASELELQDSSSEMADPPVHSDKEFGKVHGCFSPTDPKRPASKNERPSSGLSRRPNTTLAPLPLPLPPSVASAASGLWHRNVRGQSQREETLPQRLPPRSATKCLAWCHPEKKSPREALGQRKPHSRCDRISIQDGSDPSWREEIRRSFLEGSRRIGGASRKRRRPSSLLWSRSSG